MADKSILDVLTMDEIEQLEKLTGNDVNELFGQGKFSGRALKMLVWLLRKREDPNAKIEDVGSLTFSAATSELEKFVDSPKAD